jgi:ribonuclease VapC
VTTAVLDASALLAFLQDEPGADLVEEALVSGALMSAVNWAETLSKASDNGNQPDFIVSRLHEAGILGQSLAIVPLTSEDGLAIARLRNKTKAIGLSLGDRACLALALKEKAVALTTDRTWSKIRLGVRVQIIR